ncbi:non-ribosomal peptide synthetase [Flavobacterium branchiicola]|uniref:Non-ribosomal peptide synthetase n=1 Tax=Flavobacterium branchiicola TaxID=1114875 RepID=A0ABV9PK69_9FLAO|nr:non-ribosomal peptide synthetase [Flavobacterium branchiicola]MBS7256343.1 amino acid adenylation domain-containing protein [Flavobacterium branchiicola]
MLNLIKELEDNDVIISLNGDNLEINFDGELDSEIIGKIKKNKEELIRFLARHSNADSGITKAVIQESYPVSHAQKRIWLMSQVEENSKAQHIHSRVYLDGEYDIAIFEKALRKVIARHEILRTVFRLNEDGEVRQWILNEEDSNFPITYLDFSTEEDSKRKANTYMLDDNKKLFDLENGPLFRVAFLQLTANTFVFYYNMHHIITDGWSLEVLEKDIFAFYKAIKYGEKEPENIKIQYKDYVSWQLAAIEKGVYKKHEDFWLDKLSGDLTRLNLPGSKTRPKIKTFNGHMYFSYLSPQLTAKLRALCNENGGTLFVGLMSVLKVLFHKYAQEKDITLGTAVAGREDSDLEDQIGFYVNTVPLRSTVEEEDSFLTFFENEKKSILEAFSHQKYPFDMTVSKLNLAHDISRNYIFDVMVNLYNFSEVNKGIVIDEKKAEEILNFGFVNLNFDLELVFHEVGNTISLTISYNNDLYDETFVTKFINHFKNLIESVVENPTQQTKSIEYLTAEEKQEVLFDFNATEVDYPSEKTFVTLFEDQVKKTPNGIALVFDEIKLTYAQLDAKANQFACYLKTKYNVESQDKVGIKLDRSETLVISILAVLKSGAAYVPIDSAYPQERIDFIEKDSNCKVIIDTVEWNAFYSKADKYPIINAGQVVSADSSAYVIYTSGSTGNPKGVDIAHSSLTNYLLWAKDYYSENGVRNLDFGLFTSLSFDLTVTSLFLPLISGGTLTVFETTDDVSKLLTDYLKSDISSIKLTPAHISILESLDLSATAIELAVVGGEALLENQVRILQKLNPNIRIINEYGPTEATVGCIVYDVKDAQETVLIGKPIANTQIYILDEALNPVGIGVTGELYISGNGLARSYINRKDLTKEKFISNPFRAASLMYKTGDLGKWLADGNIDYTGRIDDQVKIRGYRIELGELESTLSNIREISHSVVAVKEDKGEKYLVAYYVADTTLDKNHVKSELSKVLPDYMLPGYYVQLESLPLTTNGKVDKKLLPEVGEADLIKTAYVAPESVEEKILAAAWSHVLKYENIGIKDNFYNLGGDSIKSILVISRLRQQGYSLKVEQILRTPILGDLAKMLSLNQLKVDQSQVIGDVLLTPIQHYFLNNQLFPNKDYYNQSVLLNWNGAIDAKILEKSISSLVLHHDALRMVYKYENGEWNQYNRDASAQHYKIVFYDLQKEENQLAAMQTIGEELQSTIDISSGVLFHIGHFRLSDGDRLALIINHLVIDGVSWRILLEDLSALYESHQAATLVPLPLKTDSFQRWASAQSQFAQSKTMQAERTYWENYSENKIMDFPVDFESSDIAWNLNKEYGFKLEKDITETLKTKVHDVYNTEINDILLTGLGLAIRDVFGIRKSVIAMEGHGREEIIDGVDIGRTVGWFTTLYPFVLDLSNSDEYELVTTKELLRKVPNKGIGYGILNYLDKPFENELLPRIQFNYLGDFGDNTEDKKSNQLFKFSSESIGLPLAIENTKSKILLDITGMMISGELRISIRYSADCYTEETIKKLNEYYSKNLQSLIIELASAKQKYLTASDLTYKKISNQKLAEFNSDNGIEDIYELSPLQQGLYYHWLVNRNSPLYLEQFSYSIQTNNLDIELVKQAFNKLIARYPILRTSFTDSLDDVLLQIVHKEAEGNFSFEKISADESDVESVIEKIKEDDRNRGFDMSKPSLMRLKVVETNKQNEYVFIWSHHHILMDGWCVSILVNDFYRILMALSNNQDITLPEPVKYANYINWLSKIDKNESLSYWKNYLNGIETVAEIPFKKKNLQNRDGKPVYKAEELFVNGAVFQNITQFNQDLGITLSTYIQGVWGYLLSRYNGTNDVLFGTVVSGRPGELEDVEGIVGLFSNTIPVRVNYKENDTPATFLKQLHLEMLESTTHHYINLSEVQSQSELGMGLINNIVVFENFLVQDNIDDEITSLYSQEDKKITIGKVDFADQTNYSFHTTVVPSDSWFKIEFKYDSTIFNTEAIENLKAHFFNIANQFSTGKEALNIGTIDYLTEKEKNQLLYDFNKTNFNYPKDRTIVDLFEDQAQKTPDNVAVIFENRNITYRELNLITDRLAYTLIENYNVESGDFVGIQFNRSEWVIISILGILKAGAVYIPIDSELPSDRKAFIFEDADLKLLITETAFIFDLDFDGNIFSVDVEFDSDLEVHFKKQRILPQNQAYVIYTSGSTGNPKGVEIAHSSLTNYLLWGKDYYSANRSGNLDFGLFTSLSFDLTVTSLFLPLISGGALTVFETTDDIAQLLEDYLKSDITSIKLTPAHINILESLELSSTAVELAIVGGEALLENQVRILQNLNPNIRIINEYGPTEATVGCIIYDVKDAQETVLIGKPIANTQIYILDESLNPCAIGVKGELYISGDGLASGYINRPDLTQEKFVPNPFREDTLMYKTGDLGKWLADGNIDYTGRVDDQVKIRGYRIELGELENALSNIPQISQSVIAVKEDNGEKYLVAYYVADITLDKNLIQSELSKVLPDYMLPGYYIQLEAIPITTNGKVDKKLLPSVDDADLIRSEYVAPTDEVESELVEIWQRVLNRDKIGITDNFFFLGGQSIKAIMVIAEIKKAFNVKIELDVLFNNPDIKTIATEIRNKIWYSQELTEESITDKIII